jgi:aminoglycoside 3-N-acetyltransferase
MSKISRIKNIAFDLAPGFVKDKARAYVENRKIAHWQECFKTKVSQEQVEELFSCLGLDSDVMIHSSLPDIGNIKLKHVTECLKKHVLDKGHTILCPALPIKGSTLYYLKSIKEFDVRTAPNAMGTISCYYGRQQGAIRSLSPTHSVIALGDKAGYYTAEHHLSETPFTEKSPYYRLIGNKGKILMFGASLKNLTFNHVIEDMIGEDSFPVKVYDPHRFDIELVDESGTRTSGRFRAHSHRSGRMRDSEELMEMVRNLPSTKVLPIGCGEVLLLDAKDVCLLLLTGLKDGLTTMGHRRVSEECKRKADCWIDYIGKI